MKSNNMKIFFYCGESHEPFDPKIMAKEGRGGSEEAVLHITKQFAKIGWKVTVFNNCDNPGIYDGVEWKHYEDYNAEPCDVMIVWRRGTYLHFLENFKIAYLWLHDTMPEEEVAVALQKAKKVIVLSKYHRRLYGHLGNNKFFISSNGIDLSQFKPKKKIKQSIIYMSSYDRGLKELLENWPRIKVKVPNATLKVCYGWQTWEKISKKEGKKAYKNFLSIKEDMENSMKQEGITHIGRLTHQELANLLAETDVWAYPTWWPEINCISAMKAQAAGVIPVVIPTAAVAETVVYGKKTDRGYFNDMRGNVVRPKEAIKQFIDMLTTTLLDEKYKQSERKKMMEYAQELSWDKIAHHWNKEFKEELCNVK